MSWLRGLRPEDLRVAIDGSPARVESLEWIFEAATRPDPVTTTSLAVEGMPAPPQGAPGRLVVFLFQKDFFEPGRLMSTDPRSLGVPPCLSPPSSPSPSRPPLS